MRREERCKAVALLCPQRFARMKITRSVVSAGVWSKKKFRNFPGLFSWTSFRLFRQRRSGLDATAGKVTEVEEGPELF